MNKSKFAALVVGLIGLAAALPAAAQSFYFGGMLGNSQIESKACQGAAVCDRRDDSWSGNLGFMFTQNWGLEAGYHHLGKVLETDDGAGNTVVAKTNAGDLVAVGALPFEKFSVYLKGGAYYAKTKQTSSSGAFDATSTAKQWTYGAGLRYDIWRHVAIRAEYQLFKKVGGKDVGFRGDVQTITGGLLIVF